MKIYITQLQFAGLSGTLGFQMYESILFKRYSSLLHPVNTSLFCINMF